MANFSEDEVKKKGISLVSLLMAVKTKNLLFILEKTREKVVCS